MDEYNPDNLEENVKIYDKYLNQYEQVYKNVGINVKRYSNVDEFVKKYLNFMTLLLLLNSAIFS